MCKKYGTTATLTNLFGKTCNKLLDHTTANRPITGQQLCLHWMWWRWLACIRTRPLSIGFLYMLGLILKIYECLTGLALTSLLRPAGTQCSCKAPQVLLSTPPGSSEIRIKAQGFRSWSLKAVEQARQLVRLCLTCPALWLHSVSVLFSFLLLSTKSGNCLTKWTKTPLHCMYVWHCNLSSHLMLYMSTVSPDVALTDWPQWVLRGSAVLVVVTLLQSFFTCGPAAHLCSVWLKDLNRQVMATLAPASVCLCNLVDHSVCGN